MIKEADEAWSKGKAFRWKHGLEMNVKKEK